MVPIRRRGAPPAASHPLFPGDRRSPAPVVWMARSLFARPGFARSPHSRRKPTPRAASRNLRADGSTTLIAPPLRNQGPSKNRKRLAARGFPRYADITAQKAEPRGDAPRGFREDKLQPSAGVFIGMLFGGGKSIMNLVLNSRPGGPHSRILRIGTLAPLQKTQGRRNHRRSKIKNER